METLLVYFLNQKVNSTHNYNTLQQLYRKLEFPSIHPIHLRAICCILFPTLF